MRWPRQQRHGDPRRDLDALERRVEELLERVSRIDEAKITELDDLVSDLRSQIAATKNRHRQDSYQLKTSAVRDGEHIAQVKAEADRLIGNIRGSSLFGRYAADAERHRRAADRWRWAAISVLLVSAGVGIALAKLVPDVGWEKTLAPLLPLGLLFTYCSVESSNHRVKEHERRRVYLHMAAIESYVTPDSGGRRAGADELLDAFIRRNFIDRTLEDHNYVTSWGWGRLRARSHPVEPAPAPNGGGTNGA
jgi:hypothetical protein